MQKHIEEVICLSVSQMLKSWKKWNKATLLNLGENKLLKK